MPTGRQSGVSQPTLQAVLSRAKRRRTEPQDGQEQAQHDEPAGCGGEALLAMLQTVPALRAALTALDDLRQLPCVAKDLASLAIALGLRCAAWGPKPAGRPGGSVGAGSSCGGRAAGLMDELWHELGQSDMDTHYSCFRSVINKVKATQCGLRFTTISSIDAMLQYGLTEEELQAIPPDATHLCMFGSYGTSLKAQVQVYSELAVLLASYRKWQTPGALAEGRRRAKWAAWEAQQQRQAALKARLKTAGLSGLGMNLKLIRDYIEHGAALDLEAVIETLQRDHQKKERTRVLRARLGEAGLGDVHLACTPCQAFLKGEMELEEVVKIVKEQRRQRERWDVMYARLQAEGLGQYVRMPACQQYLRAPPVEGDLEALVALFKALHDRLEAEGLPLGHFWDQPATQLHLEFPNFFGLDSLVGTIRQHERQLDLLQRLDELSIPFHINQPCCQRYIKTGAPPLDDVLHTLSTLRPPLGGPKPADKCVTFGCTHEVYGPCSGRHCYQHCADLLCRCHDRWNVQKLAGQAAAQRAGEQAQQAQADAGAAAAAAPGAEPAQEPPAQLAHAGPQAVAVEPAQEPPAQHRAQAAEGADAGPSK